MSSLTLQAARRFSSKAKSLDKALPNILARSSADGNDNRRRKYVLQHKNREKLKGGRRFDRAHALQAKHAFFEPTDLAEIEVVMIGAFEALVDEVVEIETKARAFGFEV